MRLLALVLLFTSFVVASTEAFGGLGVTVQGSAQGVTLIEVIPGSPASTIGLMPGDQITAVEGFSLQGQSMDIAVSKLRGEPGTPVHFTVIRPTTQESWNAELVRVDLRIKSLSGDELQSWYGSSQPISKNDLQYYAELNSETGFSLLGLLENGRLVQGESSIPTASAQLSSVYAGEAPKILKDAPRFARVQLKGFNREQLQFQVDEIAPVELHLLDLAGNVLHRWVVSNPHMGMNTLNWDGSNMGTGVYTLRASAVNGKAAWRVQLR